MSLYAIFTGNNRGGGTSGGGGGGSVSSFSFVDLNGISGSVSNPTTTPALTLTLGDITPSSVAASGTVTGSNLSGTNTGDVTIGTANGLSILGQVLSLALSSTSTTGALSSTDWNTFNNKQSTITLGNLTDVGTDGIVITGGTGAVVGSGTSIAQHVADATHNGYLSSTDFNTFNGKQSVISIGALNAQAANANGLALVSNVLSTQSATASFPGLLSAVGFSSIVPQSLQYNSIYYVDKARVDSYTPTGAEGLPFLTIQDAVDAIALAVGSGVIRIAPGVYDENIVLNDAALITIYMAPSGPGPVAISPSTGLAIDSSSNNSNLMFLDVRGIEIGGGINLVGATSAFLSTSGLFQNCVISGGIVVSTAGNEVAFNECFIPSDILVDNGSSVTLAEGRGIIGNLTISNSSFVTVQDAVLIGNCSIDTTSEMQLRRGTRFGSSGGSLAINGLVQAYNSIIRSNITVGAVGQLDSFGMMYNGSLTVASGGVVNNLSKYGYTPASPGDWVSPPVEVYDALDQLAGRVPPGGALSSVLTSAHIFVGNGSNVATDTAMSGDITISNTGVTAIGANKVANSQLAQMPTLTIKGNNTGGTANALDLTVAQVNTMLGDILANGTVAFTADQSMGSHKLTNVTDPSAAQDAATKAYVDAGLAALNPAAAVYAATVGSNLVGTYNNGASGVGATFTITATGAFTLDGTTPPVNSRILIKDQSSGFQNGIYDLTVAGSIGVSPILTRSLDYNTAADMNQAGLIPIINGTVNALSSWQQIAPITTVGTDSLVFAEYTANPSLYLLKANNLNDVASASASFINISPLTTAGDLIYENATPVPARLPIGSTGDVLTVVGGLPAWAPPATSGTVTSVSVTTANGVSGSVATATTTPAITLTLGAITPSSVAAVGTVTGSNLSGTNTGDVTLAAVGASPNANGASLSGQVLTLQPSTASFPGVLLAADFVTFNAKQPAGNYITALTGDAAASGPGSAALTLATVNGNVGSFGTASAVGAFTVNAKGLVTAAASTSIQIAESQVTNLVSDLAGKLSNVLTTNHIFVGTAGVATDVAMSGDATIVASGALTLATVNSNVGSFTNANITVNAKGLITAASNGTAGTVTTVSVVSANGLAGTVATATSTPAITLSTTVTGILQGNGTAISAASTTGSGSVVLDTSPTLVTPALGTPSAMVATNVTGLPLTSGVTGVLPAANVGLTRTINAQTGTTYTFVLADGSAAGGNPLVTASNGSAQTYTVPLNASVAYPVGTQIDLMQQGSGKVTIAATGGVTINSQGGNLAIAAQYVAVSLIKTATDTWTLIGNLIA